MATNWARIGRTALRLGQQYGPTVVNQVRRRLDSGATPGTSGAPGVDTVPPGRPATTAAAPTASRARQISYAPDLDGQADPGEIVWTWVAFEEEDGRGKDRPVLVVGRDGTHLLGLMLSSQDRHAHDSDWIGIGSGPWDAENRPSWVRLDRVLEVPEAGIRREGAVCPRGAFDVVADRLRSDFGWR